MLSNYGRIAGGLTLVSIVLGLFIAAGKMEVEDAVEQVTQYCTNVQYWKASNGQRGWPDYNENYEEVCND